MLLQSDGQPVLVDILVAQRLVKRRPKILFLFSRYLWTVFENIAFLASRPFTRDIKIC
jgi:hypothetical protein